MAESKPQHYEMVSIYRLDEDVKQDFLSNARECVFNWCTKDEWPMGVIMSCLWRDGRMWLTAGAHRHRISAVRRNPKVSVVLTSTGTHLGGGKTITITGSPDHPDFPTLAAAAINSSGAVIDDITFDSTPATITAIRP